MPSNSRKFQKFRKPFTASNPFINHWKFYLFLVWPWKNKRFTPNACLEYPTTQNHVARLNILTWLRENEQEGEKPPRNSFRIFPQLRRPSREKRGLDSCRQNMTFCCEGCFSQLRHQPWILVEVQATLSWVSLWSSFPFLNSLRTSFQTKHFFRHIWQFFFKCLSFFNSISNFD